MFWPCTATAGRFIFPSESTFCFPSRLRGVTTIQAILQCHKKRYPERQCLSCTSWCTSNNILPFVHCVGNFHLEPARSFPCNVFCEIADFFHCPFSSRFRWWSWDSHSEQTAAYWINNISGCARFANHYLFGKLYLGKLVLASVFWYLNVVP
jgi:hypothetical protein